MKKYLLAGLAGFMCAAQAFAGDVAIKDAWARVTAPGQDSAAVAFRITSNKAASITAVSSDAADRVEMHSMVHEDGMMKMRAMEALQLKAGQEAVLGGGDYHLMLMGLKKPLAAGDHVVLMLTLLFADKHTEKVEVKAEIRPLSESRDMHHMPHPY